MQAIQNLGAGTLFFVQKMGARMIFFFEMFFCFFQPPFQFKAIIKQIHFIGVRSMFIILLTAGFTGMVLAMQGFYTLKKFGSEGLLGSAVALTIIRELGPVLAGLMVTGRAGSAIAAEIGIMRISEQLDALDTMALNPIKYVVMPKAIAALIALPLLTGIFDVVGIMGGYLVGVKMLGVSAGAFISGIETSVAWNDIFSGMIKSVCFALLMVWISCFEGYFVETYHGYGAEGVSHATTNAVVLSSVNILIWDYFITTVMF